MILSGTVPGMDSLIAGPSSVLTKIPPTSTTRVLMGNSERRNSRTANKPWADGPWPLIETPSRTQRVTHPTIYIANELAHAHNAMLRGLNALYLQAPFIRQPGDVADFLFLVRVWGAWVLDYHVLKETVMIPGFEAILGLEGGRLTLGLTPASSSRNSTLSSDGGEEECENEEGKGKDKGKQNEPRDLALLLQGLLNYADETLSEISSYAPSTLQALLASLARTLVPHLHTQIPLLIHMRDLCSFTSPPPTPSSSSSSSPTRSIRSPGAEAAAHRATLLTQTYLSAEASFSARMDRFTIPPMVVRLRDVTADVGGGEGGGGSWPRLSVPALHAVADRLSARHAGAWRFLPCDVWGKPRELEFIE
ncbi:hypothetical protein F5Y04DRAFT_76496 [Hypomontagnella monticulosa]|nr:hypothetical protein F5Y04DRAFT_76496 [Hypomontagnella monticulosa]